MNNRPVAILSVKVGSAATNRLCARIDAITRNPRTGKQTAWLLHVSKAGIAGAVRWTDGAPFPREEHSSRVPGNLADIAMTLAMEGT